MTEETKIEVLVTFGERWEKKGAANELMFKYGSYLLDEVNGLKFPCTLKSEELEKIGLLKIGEM